MFAYTGREYDPESGLYFYRARYYSPEVGRFISKDPIGLRGGLNPYTYVHNNPINFIDPMGLKHYTQTEVNQIKNDAINGLLEGSTVGSFFGTTFEYFAGAGKYDYAANEPNSTFDLNGQTLSAADFGNYLTGFSTYYVFGEPGAIGSYMGGDFYAFIDALDTFFHFKMPDHWSDDLWSVYWINQGIKDAKACLEES